VFNFIYPLGKDRKVGERKVKKALKKKKSKDTVGIRGTWK
jgi:hypothetical protein